MKCSSECFSFRRTSSANRRIRRRASRALSLARVTSCCSSCFSSSVKRSLMPSSSVTTSPLIALPIRLPSQLKNRPNSLPIHVHGLILMGAICSRVRIINSHKPHFPSSSPAFMPMDERKVDTLKTDHPFHYIATHYASAGLRRKAEPPQSGLE